MTKKKIKKKKDEKDEIIQEFLIGLEEKHIPNIRAVILFGSVARNEENENSDIDLMVIVDDTNSKFPSFLKRVEKDIDEISDKFDKISAETVSLIEFWNGVRIGSPVIVNMVRDGVPVLDKDMFQPVKRLLELGAIKPSREMVFKYRKRSEKRIERIKYNKMMMVFEDCYLGILESASIPIILSGMIPSRPEDVPKELRKVMRELKLKGVNIKPLDEIIKLRKGVKNKKFVDVSGIEVDIWLTKTERFIKDMDTLSRKIKDIKVDGPFPV